MGGVSETVRDRIQEAVPSVTSFETVREWSDTPAGSLLFADERTALASVHTGDRDDAGEVATRGAGARNSLVVVLRAVFARQLERAGSSTDEPARGGEPGAPRDPVVAAALDAPA